MYLLKQYRRLYGVYHQRLHDTVRRRPKIAAQNERELCIAKDQSPGANTCRLLACWNVCGDPGNAKLTLIGGTWTLCHDFGRRMEHAPCLIGLPTKRPQTLYLPATTSLRG
jgi:hypothetical protein